MRAALVAFVMILGSLLSSPLPRGGNVNCVSRPAAVLFSHALVIRAHMARPRHRSSLSPSLSLSLFSSLVSLFLSKITLSLSPLVAAIRFVALPEIDGGSAEVVAFNGTFKSLCAFVYVQRRPISTVVARINGRPVSLGRPSTCLRAPGFC